MTDPKMELLFIFAETFVWLLKIGLLTGALVVIAALFVALLRPARDSGSNHEDENAEDI